MQVLRHKDQLEIILFQPETYLLKESLADILNNYQCDPTDLPQAIRELWYAQGREMEQEDCEIWMEQLRGFRGENSLLVERLLESTKQVDQWPLVLSVDLIEADQLLSVLNDQRLYLAALHDVGEIEMSENWDELLLSDEKRAVGNIHFLAWLIELIIMRLGSTM